MPDPIAKHLEVLADALATPGMKAAPSTPVPSGEAVEAACGAQWGSPPWPRVAGAEREREYMRVALAAAYAIDAPRIAAEAAAEARADYDDFIEGLTAKLNAAGVPAMPSWPDAIDWLIARAQSAQAEARAATLREVVRWLKNHGGHAAARDLAAHFNPEANE